MKNIKILDYIIENDLNEYYCDLWYEEPGYSNYKSSLNLEGQINYRNNIFVITHTSRKYGRGGMDEDTPPGVKVLKIKI